MSTSMTGIEVVGSARRRAQAVAPLEGLRTARMRVEAWRARSWWAVSKPGPWLPSVMIINFPVGSTGPGRWGELTLGA
jgi:hypothetical protein